MTTSPKNLRTITSKFIYLICCFFVFVSLPLTAAESHSIDLAQFKSGQTTGDNYQFLQDKSLRINLEQAKKSTQWMDPESGVTNRGFNKNATWMRINISNSSDSKINGIFEYVDPAVASIDTYILRGEESNQAIESYNFTYNKPIKTRPVSHFRPAFPISLDGNSTAEVYFRIYAGDEIPMHSFTSFRIWETSSFNHASDKEIALKLVLLCVEIFMGLATLILFIVLHKKIFLYYSFFAFSAASLFASFSGLWSYFISTNGYELSTVVFQIGLCQVASFLFARVFLETKQHFPKIDTFLLAIIVLNIFGLLLNILGYPYFSRVIIDYTAVTFFTLIPIGLMARSKGVPHSLLFTISWIIFIIGMALASMRLRGYIDDSFIAQNLIYFGGFVEASLLITIVILTVHSLQKEKEKLELIYRTNLQESADKLKVQVNEKTLLLKQAKDKAEKEARIDILTGINNRRAFMEKAEQYIGRAKRDSGSQLHLAIIDIDHFKNVNDTHGHSAGDSILQSVARILQETVRKIDSVSRIGGEEFAILMSSQNQKGILELCDRLRANVENLVSEFDQQKIQITISIGLSAYEQGDSIDAFFQKSDKALYLAKLQGRNQVVTLNNEA